MTEELIAGRYSIVREVGRGASATVYLAHDQMLDRDIAIKIVAPALANDPSFVDRFVREARLSAGLNHPNIVTVHDVGETGDGRPFIAMALVSGASLETVIQEHAPLPVSEASRILTGLGSALDYLHGQGLIHRDVKPSNVLVEESGRVMLSDFGIAYARESARYTMTGILLGTPRYMAPEQMLGEEPTPQTDVYAMGVIAFEMLAGAPPFEGTGTGLMYKIVHEPPPAVSSIAPDIPAGIEAAIVRALQKDPQQRWASPGEFAAAIASPDANATMLGPSARPPAPVLVPLPVSEPVAADSPEPEIEADAPPPPPVYPGGAGSGGGGKKKAIVGVAGAGLVGVLVASYCLAAGGANPKTSSDNGLTASPTAATATTTPGRTPSPAASKSASATATTGTPVSAATTTAVPSGATQPPPPPPAATATRTSVPASTSTSTPSATSTGTATPSATPTGTSTPTPSPTSTNTPSPTPTATPTTAPPNPPSNVNLSGNTLSWSDNSNNETGFRIYWRTTGLNDNVVHVTNDKSVGPNTTSTSVATVNYTFDQTDFRRGVSAYNVAGESIIVWNK